MRIRGDRDDVFSQGYICPKGSTLKQLHEDPDRLRRPLVKRDGAFVEVELGRGVRRDRARACSRCSTQHGRDAAAVYIGNPNAHNLAGHALQPGRPAGPRHHQRVLGVARSTSARRRSPPALMFGGGLNVPVPDVDRTDHLLMLGANPFASNGCLATAPDWPGRLERAGRAGRHGSSSSTRGASRTAEMATEWVPIRPGADAYLLMAMVQVITSEGLVDLGALRRPRHRPRRGGRGARRRSRPRPWPTPPGSTPTTIRRLARELAAAAHRRASTAASAPPPPSSAPSRRGWSTCSTCSPATSTGPAAPCSPRRPPAPATPAASRGYGREVRLAPAHAAGCASCPRPSASCRRSCMAEEIDTPGRGADPCPRHHRRQPGAVHAELGAGSTPPWRGLECMVSVDIYVNETTRHADVILPAPVRPPEGPLRPRPPPARAARHRQLQRAGAARSTTTSPTSGRCWPASRSCSRAPAPTADPALVDDLMITSLVQAARGRRDQPDPRPRRRRDPRAPRAPHRPGAHPRPPAAHRPLRRGLRRRPRRAVARQAARQPARHRPRRPQAPPPRRAPHARRA